MFKIVKDILINNICTKMYNRQPTAGKDYVVRLLSNVLVKTKINVRAHTTNFKMT